MNMIAVIVKEPRKRAYLTNIKDSLESMQKLVGGDIYHLPIFNHPLTTYCRELEPNDTELPLPNIYLYGGVIMGTIFVCRAGKNGEALSVFPENIVKIMQELNSKAIN